MKRRETYATTGPRMVVRFFGGWDFEASDANNRMPARVGYTKGVPMGGDLSDAPKGKSPTFLVAALKDPIGANLDRIQVIKGWLGKDGKTQERIYDVAVSGGRKIDADGRCKTDVGNTVDVPNATWSNTIGASELITVWKDPDFDPALRAFYYVRVIEIPTPRWTAYDAKYFGDQTAPGSPHDHDRARLHLAHLVHAMKKLIREPLVHFLLLGGALFGVYAALNRDQAESREDIVVTSGQIENLAATFAKVWQRPPTAEELKGQIDQYVKEEILSREAVKLGLDQNDTVIRRRLQQKMEFIAEDFAAAAEPTDAELADYLAKHPDQFAQDQRFTFRQVFLNPEKRGDQLEADTAALLAELKRRGADADVSTLGDSLSFAARIHRRTATRRGGAIRTGVRRRTRETEAGRMERADPVGLRRAPGVGHRAHGRPVAGAG